MGILTNTGFSEHEKPELGHPVGSWEKHLPRTSPTNQQDGQVPARVFAGRRDAAGGMGRRHAVWYECDARANSSELVCGASTNRQSPEAEESSALVILNDMRRRKRESMQRIRQRQKQSIESMRVTLQTLSLEFERLREQQQRTSDLLTRLPKKRLSFMHSEKDFGSLAETSHRLKAEKLQLQRMIMEREMAVLRLADVVKSCNLAAMLKNEQRLALPLKEPAAQYFEYTDFSPEQIQAAISSCYLRIKQHERTARPLAHWVVGVDAEYQTFGWTVRCDISTGSKFSLSMIKRLPLVKPQDAMKWCWDALPLPTETNLSSRRLVRLAVLQILDDKTFIVGEDVHHPTKPGVRMRTITACFCLATERGYELGTATMNPTSPEVRSLALPAVEYLDSFSLHEYVRDDEGSGCVITLKSLTQYDTNESLRLRLMNALCCTRLLESEVLRNPMRLIKV